MFHVKQTAYDVAVIGAGHAGCEAAHAAWRMGCRVALLTFRASDIGVMSCNPAIGGLGKGHLVREIDAMDGIMGRVADRAGIQFRLLNRTKGPAVQGPRLQADRKLYATAMRETIAETNIDVILGEVVDLIVDASGHIGGVRFGDGTALDSRRVILTSGTFLGGVIHVGRERSPGGRFGAAASTRLGDRLRDHGLSTGRLKTGTPPRLRSSSIDWSGMEMQRGDDAPVMLSFLSKGSSAKQVECGIAHTNERTHEIVRQHIGESALFSGTISGSGPRYCPSIEDKIVRFADKTSHQVFLEPEGLDSDIVYPNGISTSLPAHVQAEYVQSIAGLEKAEIVQAGYAIEYDFLNPQTLDRTFHLDRIPGLYLAGQINGTTGYEEAAAQGLVAGLNAALTSQGRDRWVPLRSESYLGVLADDLVTRGVTEPYRMFTSRAEFRLILRADNADQRLTPNAIELGCVGNERTKSFSAKIDLLDRFREKAETMIVKTDLQRKLGADVRKDGPNRTLFELLGLNGVDPSAVTELLAISGDYTIDTILLLSNDAIYSEYVKREAKDAKALKDEEAMTIPAGLVVNEIGGLSAEIVTKLRLVRPETIGQASRIEGMTPAALVILFAASRKIDHRNKVST